MVRKKIWEKVNLGGFRFHFTTNCGGRRISSLLFKKKKFFLFNYYILQR